MFPVWVLSNFLGFGMCVAHTMMRAIVFALFINGIEAPPSQVAPLEAAASVVGGTLCIGSLAFAS